MKSMSELKASNSKCKSKLSYASITMTPVIIYVASLLKGVQAKEAVTDWLQTNLESDAFTDMAESAIIEASPNNIAAGQVSLLDDYAHHILENQEAILSMITVSDLNLMKVHQFEQTDFVLISEVSDVYQHTDATLWHHDDIGFSTSDMLDDIAIQAATENTELSSAGESGSSSSTWLWVGLGTLVVAGIVVGAVVGTDDDAPPKKGSPNSEPEDGTFLDLTVEGTSDLQGEVTARGDIAVSGQVTAKTVQAETMIATDTMEMQKDLSVGNDLTVDKDLRVSVNIDVGADATVEGKATVGGLDVNGTTTLTGALDANSTADIADTLTLSKASGTGLSVTSNATVDGTFGVKGASTLTGNTTVGGTLGVTGVTTTAGLTDSATIAA